jgi:predicted nucleotide-binding protein (sugar kinase/HSP70/actin superfamily)
METEKLPVVTDLMHDPVIEAELAEFEAAQRTALGLDRSRGPGWRDDMIEPAFTASQRPHTTLLVSGLTMAHDYFVQGALRGVGYKVEHLECPDNDALRVGKEFGNRGQCNPTYFTVGNLVKSLTALREKGQSTEDVIRNYVFLTAGACGPCRFGMYVTEYRKALRDAGFEGFRVVLFQQTGGLKQATGEEAGLKMDPTFFTAIAKALLAGDVLNALCYRVRPYEVEAGATDRAAAAAKKLIYQALDVPFDGHVRSLARLFLALRRSRAQFAAVKVDRLQPKPKVSIIGEFWAMTTEGDGNYQLQRFLESEGAECDVQLVAAWLLYMLWEARYDTTLRADLRGVDEGRRAIGGVDVAKKMAILAVAERAVRGVFAAFANTVGLSDYHLADMDEVARVSAKYYNHQLRGGEGHMEVGKLILNVLHHKAHMTVSVKPFGCMPSSGVSDGVQSAVTERLPGAIFCAVETSGDGRVNFYSRVQMFLFKAKQAARDEYERTLAQYGLDEDQVRAWLLRHPRYASPLHKAPHRVAGSAADLIHEIAPHITMTPWQRASLRAREAVASARQAPAKVARLGAEARKLPKLAAQARHELKESGPALAAAVRAKVASKVQPLRSAVSRLAAF